MVPLRGIPERAGEAHLRRLGLVPVLAPPAGGPDYRLEREDEERDQGPGRTYPHDCEDTEGGG